MRLYQLQNGYCYNSDTLFLYDFICNFTPKGRLLDFGSGSGILGLLLKRDFDIELTQLELQSDVCAINTINAQTNNLKSEVHNINFIEFKSDKKFDFIVSNPPFYDSSSKQSENTNLKTSRSDDSLSVENFIKKANSLITNRGYLIFCYRSNALCDILHFAKVYKFNLNFLRFVHPKVEKEASIALFCFQKSAKKSLSIKNPLIVHDDSGFTLEAKKIFEKTDTYSIKCLI